jgi:hypothetical protein
VLDDLIPSAWHHVERYANNRGHYELGPDAPPGLRITAALSEPVGAI